MTVRELYACLEERIPKTLSFEWDNDGLLCCPDGSRGVSRVLVTLDVTAQAVEYAIKGKYDCIVSHHPFIFKGIKAIDEERAISAKAIRLIEEGISVMSFHTRLDALEGGVNDTLCSLLGLSNITCFCQEGIPLGRIGNVSKDMTAEEFASFVKETLGAPFVLLSDTGRTVRRVAIVGGSGKDMIEEARAAKADTFVSGRFDYHPMTDARDVRVSPINLIEAGHFYTEQPVCNTLVKMIQSIDKDIVCDIYYSNAIKAI